MGSGDGLDGGFCSSAKLLDRLNTLCRNIDRRLCKHSATGFLFGQGRLLSSLALSDGVSQSVLSKSTALSPATVTEMLDKLEAAGFVGRSRDGRDSRKLLVYITDSGRAAAEEMEAVRGRAVTELFSVLSDEEREAFGRLLQKLNRSLDGGSPQGSADEPEPSPARARPADGRPGKIRGGIRLR